MSKRILVVDDEIDILKVVLFRLQNAGYTISSAQNGKEAWELLQEEPAYDLLLLDLTMPVMDGYEFLKKVKANASFSDIPILILSGTFIPSIEKKMEELQVQGYFLKPFDASELLSRVKSIIG